MYESSMDDRIAILQLMHAPGLGQRTLSRILGRLAIEHYPIGEFVSAPTSELTSVYRLKPETARSVGAYRDSALKLSEELDSNQVRILVKGTAEYPDRLSKILAHTAPPVLFTKGNLGIMSVKAVGFCGSRKVSEKGCRVAGDSASILAKKGINITSGYAHGVDLAAHRAALAAGGPTTIVLAAGIQHFTVKRAIADVLTPSNHLVVSEFPPRMGWAAHNAMQRNRTICGMSAVMLLVESGPRGGTFEAGKTALELGIPLFVVDFATRRENSKGNVYFLQSGAKPLRGNREGRPNLTGVFRSLEKDHIPTKQTSLLE